MSNNNMAGMGKFFLAFGVMALTNELLEPST
jgi:hypothetical protein